MERMIRCGLRARPSVAFLLLCTLYSPGILHSQTAPTRIPVKVGATRLTCAGVLQLLLDQATGTASDTAILRVSSRGAADQVLSRLTDLALSRPQCPAAIGMRGLVKLRLRRTNWPPKDGPGQRAGVTWMESALYDLAETAKVVDPAAAPAATLAARFLLPDKVDRPDLVRELGPSLLKPLALSSAVPDTTRQLQRGILAAWLGMSEIADSAYSAYQSSGGSPERAALELARVRLAMARPGADSLYFEAAAAVNPEIQRTLRHDLSLIADSLELAKFDAAPLGERPQWLRRFWEGRDLASMRPRGSRLREHYRRIDVARERFRVLVYPRHYELNELWRNRDAEYDDRGLVYIRHGEPDQIAQAVRSGACPNSSWLYRRAEGNLVFHFVARQNPDDWRLVETLANVGGSSGASTRLRQAGSTRRCAPVEGLLESRASLDPIYSQLAVNSSRINWERELALTTQSREVGTRTDSDLPRFARSLDVVWRAYGLLGAAAGQGRALVLVSVPAEVLVPISQDPLAYGFRTRLVARSGGRVVEIDSVRMLGAPQPPKPGQMLTFNQEVPLPAGTWNIGVSLEQPEDTAGQVLRDRDVSVPNSAGANLALSDIVLGDKTGGRPWMAPDGPFPLSSTGRYTRGEPVTIYYEIAGAAVGSELQTEVTLSDEKGKNRSVIRFSERPTSPTLHVRRELSTSKSRRGGYRLDVKIRSSDGRNAERLAALSITED